MEDPGVDQEHSQIAPPDLENLDTWFKKLKEAGIVKPSVSFAHQSKANQWKSMREQAQMFTDAQRARGVPDEEIARDLVDFVKPKPTTSEHT